MKMRKLVAALLAVLLLCSIIPFSAMAEGNSATIDFGDKANRVSYSTSQQVWAQNGITVTNDKAASTSNVGDYGGEGYPVRFYKSSAVTVEYLGMTQIVFNCDDYKDTYATDLAASITEGSVSVDGTVVTVTLAAPADTFVIAELAAQVRVDSITVYGEGGGSVVPPVDPEEPPVEPEEPPVDPEEPDVPAEPTGSATIDFGDKANRVSYSTSQQVWAQNGITVTNDKGASTSNVGDYGGDGYPVRFYKSSTVTVEYPGMTQIVFNCDDYKATYATDLAASITEGSVSVDGIVVTVTLAAPADTFVIAELAAQVRVDSITVYGEGGGSVVPPVDPEEPPVEPEEPPVDPEVPVDPVEPASSATIDFGDKANRVSYSTEQQVWAQNGITVTNDKGASTSNVGDYGGDGYPVRFYKSSTVTVEYPGMTQIVFNCDDYKDTYATDLADSIIDASVSVDGTVVTVILAAPADTFVIAELAAQVRVDSITVYTGEGGGETPEDPDVPNEDPEPDTELTIAEAIALGASKEHNVYTAGWYYVTGVITEVYNTQWGNMYITDGEGNTLTIYGSYSADGELRYDAMDVKPVAGDTVTIYGMVGQYNGNPQIKNGWIVAHIPGEGGGETPVDPPVEPPVSDEIETDYPFLFGMTQYNVSEDDVYFLAGGMAQTYYFATTTNPDEAIVVYVEAAEGGYYFYTYDVEDNKVYINMVVSGTHVNGAYETTAATVYRYDAEYGTLIANVNGADYWFGTRNDMSYTTVGPCKVEYEGFYCEFYYFEDEPPVEPCEHEYDNACDDECNLCGELREVGDHVYDDEYDADCNECGAIREVPEEPVYVGGIAASTNTGAVGENVNVQIQVDNNPGIVSVKVKVHFDNTVLKLVSYEAGNFSAGGYSWGDVAAANEKGYFIVNWCDATQPNSTAQMLATLTFEVLESAQVGEMYDIVPEFDCVNDIFNAADDTVWFYAVNGGVTIVDKTAAAGDANGDDKVNNKDLALLQQYLADWDVAIDEDVVDVNNDGKVNNKDLALLQQYLADWDVELA